MLYDQYAKKIKRYADIRDAVLRFKIPIICVLAIIIALCDVVLVVKLFYKGVISVYTLTI